MLPAMALRARRFFGSAATYERRRGSPGVAHYMHYHTRSVRYRANMPLVPSPLSLAPERNEASEAAMKSGVMAAALPKSLALLSSAMVGAKLGDAREARRL